MIPPTTRRNFLAAVAAVTAAASPEAIAAAPRDTELLALAERHRLALAACRGHGDDDEAIDRAADLVTDLDYEIANTPAESARGFLVKLRVAVQCIGPGGDTVDDALLLSVAEDAERLFGGEVLS